MATAINIKEDTVFIDSIPTEMVSYSNNIAQAQDWDDRASHETREEYLTLLEAEIKKIQKKLGETTPTNLSPEGHIVYVVKLLAKADAYAIFLNIFSHERYAVFAHSLLTGNLTPESDFPRVFYKDLFSMTGFLYQFFGSEDYFRTNGKRAFAPFTVTKAGETIAVEAKRHGDALLKMIRNQLGRGSGGHMKFSLFNRVLSYLMILQDSRREALFAVDHINELVDATIDYIVTQADTDDFDKGFLRTMLKATLRNL